MLKEKNTKGADAVLIGIGMGEPKTKKDFTIPVAALKLGDTMPAAGDDVEFTVTGRVSGLDGDFATVEPSAVNGEPFTAPKAPKAKTQDDEEAELMAAAAEADEKGDEEEYA